MQLFYISATANAYDPLSLDLFVTASSPRRALEIWQSWVDQHFDGVEPGELNVFLVPAPGDEEKAHYWHTPGGVQQLIP